MNDIAQRHRYHISTEISTPTNKLFNFDMIRLSINKSKFQLGSGGVPIAKSAIAMTFVFAIVQL